MVIESSLWNVVDKVCATLKADSELMANIKAVYTQIPHNNATPYVSIELEHIEDWSTHTTTGVIIDLNILTVTQKRTQETVLRIMSRIKTVLHQATLENISGGEVIGIAMKQSRLLSANAPHRYEGEMIFQIMIEEV